MRIGVDARPLTGPTFGIGRYARELLERMFSLSGDHEWFLYADRPLSLPKADRVNIRQFTSHSPVFSVARTQFTFAHWAVLDNLDVFWSPRHHLPLLLDIPQVLTIHDLVWRRFPQTMKRTNLFIESLFMPASLARAKKIIAVSHATKLDIETEFQVDPEKVVVIYGAASSQKSTNISREISEDYFLFVGTNEPRKNLPRLFEAYRQYLNSGGRKRLVIVGAAGWGSKISEQDGCLMLGYVDDDRLDALVSHAYALVMPSLYEGFGLPLIEAIQRGVPVVASDVAAMPEVVGKAGILVDPLKSSSICSALHQMDDPQIHSKTLGLCSTQARKFSWDIAAEETLQIIVESIV